ncbi:MAG: MarR family winged helix-turn-helix transcriptional regulator, partial [Burkholderiaceae bacterium]
EEEAVGGDAVVGLLQNLGGRAARGHEAAEVELEVVGHLLVLDLHLHQLEQEGLVARVQVEGDRRATRIRLTAKGAQSFRRMARQHEQWVIQAFSSLTDTQMQQLHTLLGKVKTGLIISDAERQVA